MGSITGDKGKAVTVGLDGRWRYTIDFECLPKVIREIAWRQGEWTLEDAWPLEARVSIAVSVELEL